MCSFAKPTSKKPSLLKHDEVELLFHELGHGIHDLVAKTKYAYFHGPMTVIDFGETPSQMLEHWCWIPERMKNLSHNYSYLSPEYKATWEAQASGKSQPSEQISDEIVESLMKSKLIFGPSSSSKM
jgi:metallopeptidase MepB